MHTSDNHPRLSPSGLTNHLGCQHLTRLEWEASRGERTAPPPTNRVLELLQERGRRHEAAYAEHLAKAGFRVHTMEARSVQATFEAMRDGHDFIFQAQLAGPDEGGSETHWQGRADVLRKVSPDRPLPLPDHERQASASDLSSRLGDYHYIVEDTKLARTTKGATLLQLSVYSELLARLQERTPEWMHVITPGTGFEPEPYRVDAFAAYYRLTKESYERAIHEMEHSTATYPYIVGKCAVCRWWSQCDEKRRQDDHLGLIAGIRRRQVLELESHDVRTMAGYSAMPSPLPEPMRIHGVQSSFTRVHQQAIIQVKGRAHDRPIWELREVEDRKGLNLLPKPDPGDVYFDIEGDRFHDEGGMEYLFGTAYRDSQAEEGVAYHAFWGLSRAEEKDAFDRWIQLVGNRRALHPDLHVYHFSPYEPAAVKRLAMKHRLHEDLVDDWLRNGVFVDLARVLRESVRTSLEGFSLKDYEQLTEFERRTPLDDAAAARFAMSCAFDFGDLSNLPDEQSRLLENYNMEDCVATLHLHRFAEGLFQEVVEAGGDVARRIFEPKTPGDNQQALNEEAQGLIEALERRLPDDPAAYGEQDRALNQLAHMVEFYRREFKAAFWEFFRLSELDSHELLDERKGLGGLRAESRIALSSKGNPTVLFSYPPQEVDLKENSAVYEAKKPESRLGTVVALDREARTIAIKLTGDSRFSKPEAIYGFEHFGPGVKRDAFFDFVRAIIQEMESENGLTVAGRFNAGRDLLFKTTMRGIRTGAAPLPEDPKARFQTLVKLTDRLQNSVLPIQGPPGSGKTHLSAKLILNLLLEGKKVGVTALSHKVIANLLDKVRELAAQHPDGHVIGALKKKSSSWSGSESDDEPFSFDSVHAALGLLRNGRNVVGGTTWLWASPQMRQSVDYLFVDEAGQLALADVLAAGTAARNLILVGDPRQLEQPQMGVHPEASGVSAMEHLLDGAPTMPARKGVFLDRTWRLPPSICEYTSNEFYNGQLDVVQDPSGKTRSLAGPSPFSGNGLFAVPVTHRGNSAESPEEANAVAALVEHLLTSRLLWQDPFSNVRSTPLSREHILIIAPYNAQVSRLSMHSGLQGIRIGTVDKFQGQEAPVVIYSLTSSTAEDAPRGLNFLLNRNRMNVATSRAQGVNILVASPELLQSECHTIEQMSAINSLCRYWEMARLVEPKKLSL